LLGNSFVKKRKRQNLTKRGSRVCCICHINSSKKWRDRRNADGTIINSFCTACYELESSSGRFYKAQSDPLPTVYN
jgi:hypothetical protein